MHTLISEFSREVLAAGVAVFQVGDAGDSAYVIESGCVEVLVGSGPAQRRVAVLADRCAATLPIHADVIGARLQIAPAGIVECHVPPYEPDFRIELLQPQRAG